MLGVQGRRVDGDNLWLRTRRKWSLMPIVSRQVRGFVNVTEVYTDAEIFNLSERINIENIQRNKYD
jgi:hypothetical protein